MPEALAEKIDTVPGILVIFTITVALFIKSHPLLGVIGIVAATELVRRSGLKTGRLALRMFSNTEERKWALFEDSSNTPAAPVTLEQNVIKKMASRVSGDLTTPTYTPYDRGQAIDNQATA